MPTAQIIAVIGSTGQQGSGVVSALLSSTLFSVRALTTNPLSDKAQALLTKHADAVENGRFEVVEGNLQDGDSLVKAFEGCYGLFAAWMSYGDEVAEGKALVDAAKATGIEHFVYSSLPSIKELSGGQLTRCTVVEAKAPIERYAREQLAAVTALLPGGFFSNFGLPLYTKRSDDGTVVFHPPFNSSTIFEMLDESYDVGVFAAAIFNKGPQAMSGKSYPVGGKTTSIADLATEYGELTGDEVVYEERVLDEVPEMTGWPTHVRESLGDLFKWAEQRRPGKICYGSMAPEEDTSFEDLGVRASTMKEWLDRTGFRVK
ncbi:hypothetical protein JCM6882_007095 [Rhodosporidiobolus microsporus]